MTAQSCHFVVWRAGAGFYLNATQDPWSKNYNMYDYVLHVRCVVYVELCLPLKLSTCRSCHR